MILTKTDYKIMELFADKELKFGCLVEMMESHFGNPPKQVKHGEGVVLGKSTKDGEVIVLNTQKEHVDSHSGKYDNSQMESWGMKSLKILGTPPRLDDIVEKFKEFFCERRGLTTLVMVLEGRMLSHRAMGKVKARNALWVLEHWENGKSALEQTQEVKEKLIELLNLPKED